MKQIQKILCVTDLSDISRNAEHAALRLAKALDARLTVLCCGESYSHDPNAYLDENVIQPPETPPYTEEYLSFVEQKKQEVMDHFKNIMENAHADLRHEVEYQVKLENEVTATLDLLEDRKSEFDLVVVGKEKSNFWERFLFGVPAKEISDETKIATLFMPTEEKWSHWLPNQILVATALNESSEFAEEVGAFIAYCLKAELVLSHVVDVANLQVELNISHIFPIDYMPSQIPAENTDVIKDEKSEELTKLKMKLEKAYRLKKIETQIEFGTVGDTLLRLLDKNRDESLLIMGSRGQNALKRFFLGSNTDTLEEACPIPLLIAQHY